MCRVAACSRSTVFEAALTDKAAKQRMWAYIKQLTPAAAPL